MGRVLPVCWAEIPQLRPNYPLPTRSPTDMWADGTDTPSAAGKRPPQLSHRAHASWETYMRGHVAKSFVPSP